jgi:putative permease
MKFFKNWFGNLYEDPQFVFLGLFLLSVILILVFFGNLLVSLLISLILAYLLDSGVQFLKKNRVPGRTAFLIIYFSFLFSFVGIILFLTPVVSRQLTQAVQDFPSMVESLNTGLQKLPDRITAIDKEQFNQIFKEIKLGLQNELTQASGTIGKNIVYISLSSFRAIVLVTIYTILVPVLVFFMLKDKELLKRWFVGLLPKERNVATAVWKDVNKQIGNYIRGKMIEIVVVGTTSFIVFLLLGLKYSVLMATLVGLSVIIPYVGATVVTFPIAIVAFTQWGVSYDFMWLMIAYLIVQILDGYLLVPLLFSEVVNLHPIAVIVAILVFGGIWGFWGAFFAIPLATLVQAILIVWKQRKNVAPA